MHQKSPVDELAEIRAEILRLKARAERIESSLIVNPHLRESGTFHFAELSETRRRLLEIMQLPPEIHKNPQFWRELIQRSIALVPRDCSVKDDSKRPLLRRDGRMPLH